MRRAYKNQITNAGRGSDLTNHPGNGFQQNLRIDAIRVGDWPFPDNYQHIMPNPKLEYYDVVSNNMSVNSRDAIFPKDTVYAEVIPLEKAVPGKDYLVSDTTGNVLLCRINEVIPGRAIELTSLNATYKATFLKRDEIKSLAMIFRRERPMISSERFTELFDEPYPFRQINL